MTVLRRGFKSVRKEIKLMSSNVARNLSAATDAIVQTGSDLSAAIQTEMEQLRQVMEQSGTNAEVIAAAENTTARLTALTDAFNQQLAALRSDDPAPTPAPEPAPEPDAEG
jgi:uncharacterized membrane protein YccC